METKKCPFCGEEIKIEAIKCKHCGEFIESKKEETESEKNSKLLMIPQAWYSLKKSNVYLDELSQSDVNKIFDFISSIIEIGLVFFLFLLTKYVVNFIKEFPSLKIFFWLYLISVVFSLWMSIAELSSSETELGAFISIILFLLLIVLIVCQFILSRTLMKIKNDTIGGLKTIGTAFFIFVLVDIFWFLISMTIAFLEGIEEGLNEELNDVAEASSLLTTTEIIGSLISISFSFVIIHLISKTIKKAIEHNEKITNSNIKNEE